VKRTPIRRGKPLPRATKPLDRSTRGCAGPCENAHVKTGGAGRKADARWIVPLCRPHHAEIHQHGQRSFEVRHDIDLAFWASIIDARWEAYRAAIPDTLKARPK
jgi:hypothetical protein